MIEIERKFAATPEQIERLTQGAELVGTKENIDVYYDTPTFELTKQSIWLRSRSGSFELKFPLGDFKGKLQFTQYDEIEDDQGIAKKLGIPLNGKTLEASLETLRYLPFATITTTRTKYKKNGISIDVDRTDFGYDIVELEAMVENQEEIPTAYQSIIDFAAAAGVEVGAHQVRGKVIEYIRRNNPAHFKMLQEAWGITL